MRMFSLFQDAMKAQNIEFKEIDADYLGSEKEYKQPNGANANSSSSSGSAKSWQAGIAQHDHW